MTTNEPTPPEHPDDPPQTVTSSAASWLDPSTPPAPDDTAELRRLEGLLKDQVLHNLKTHGLARGSRLATPLHPRYRRALVASRAHSAHESIAEVQRSLLDDSPEVRQEARRSLRDLLYRLYVGEHNDRDGAPQSRPWLDRTIVALVGGRDPDGPEPRWSRPEFQTRLRSAVIVSTLLMAVVSGLLVVTDRWTVALAGLSGMGALMILDAAFSRLSSVKSAEIRWASCVASHAGDVFVLGCIAYAQVQLRYEWTALVMAAAALVSLFASFVRVSALQAGHRSWFSLRERQVRYFSMLIIAVAASTVYSSQVIVSCGAAIMVVGCVEAIRVVRVVFTGPSITTGDILFVGSDDTLHLWSLTDTDEELEVASSQSRSRHSRP
ncbi:hypothetical protein [Nocardioides sp.]|uniref:hypothetical protein n=1 Tax=Nocardioides sp. TaxID=35761 RepID=UPI003D144DB4